MQSPMSPLFMTDAAREAPFLEFFEDIARCRARNPSVSRDCGYIPGHLLLSEYVENSLFIFGKVHCHKKAVSK